MKKTQAIFYLICSLTGCTSWNESSIYEVDFEHLVRSAFYTQQALLRLHLMPNTDKNSPQYDLLIGSYCDLIDRGYVINPEKPEPCNPSIKNLDPAVQQSKSKSLLDKHAKKRYCFAIFHRCFNNCSLKNAECTRCEKRGIRCLKKLNLSN